MPTRDPVDQDLARQYEAQLKLNTACGTSSWELAWLVKLPKRVRRSWELLRPALEAEDTLRRAERTRTTLHVAAEATNAKRLAIARSTPCDLSCLHVEGASAWNGLGRRKRRCRTFHAIGHTFAAQRCLVPAAAPMLSSREPKPLPTRPPTPDGLRVSIFNNISLLTSAAHDGDAYGCLTRAPTPPPVLPSPPPPPPPPLPVCTFQTFARNRPLTLIGPYEVANSAGFVDMVMDSDVVSAVSMGRHSMAPWPLNDFPAVVQAARESELEAPGGLVYTGSHN